MNLYNNGWQVIKCEDKKSLSLLKKKVFEQAKKIFKYNPKNIDDGLDNFHKYLKNLKDTELNEFTVNPYGCPSGFTTVTIVTPVR